MSFEVKFGSQPDEWEENSTLRSTPAEYAQNGRGQRSRGRGQGAGRDRRPRPRKDGGKETTEGAGVQQDSSGSENSDGASSVTSESQRQERKRGRGKNRGHGYRGRGGRGRQRDGDGEQLRGSRGDLRSGESRSAAPAQEIHIHFTAPPTAGGAPRPPSLQSIFSSLSTSPHQPFDLQPDYLPYADQRNPPPLQLHPGQAVWKEFIKPPVRQPEYRPSPLGMPPLFPHPAETRSGGGQSISHRGREGPVAGQQIQTAASRSAGPSRGSSQCLDQRVSGQRNDDVRPKQTEVRKGSKGQKPSGAYADQSERRPSRQNEQEQVVSKGDNPDIPELSPDEWIKIFNLLLKTFKGRTLFGTLLSNKGDLFKGLSHAQAALWLKHSNRFLTFEKNGKIRFVQINFRDARLCFKYRKHNTERCEDKNCPFFHMCRDLISGFCSRQSNCHFNHSFHTKSNAKLCSEAGLQAFTDEEIRVIVLRSTPVVCAKFNSKGCNEDCPDLHVCAQFIQNRCSNESCRLGHAIRGVKHNDWVLETFHMQNIPEHTLKKMILTVKEEPQQGNGTGKPSTSAQDQGIQEQKPRPCREPQDKPQGMTKHKSREKMTSSVSELSVPASTMQGTSPSTEASQQGRKPRAPKNRHGTRASPSDVSAADEEKDAQQLPHVYYAPVERGNQLDDEPKARFVLRRTAAAAEAEGIEGQRGLPASRYKYLCEYHTWTEGCSKGYLCPRNHHRDKPPFVWQLQVLGDWLDFSPQDGAVIEQLFCRLRRQVVFEVIIVGLGDLEVRVDFDAMMGTVAVSSASSLAPQQTLKVRRWSTPSYVEAESAMPFALYTQWIWFWQQPDGGLFHPFCPGTLQYTLEQKYLHGQRKYYFEEDEERFLLLLQDMKLTHLGQGLTLPVLRRPFFSLQEHSASQPVLSPMLLTEPPELWPNLPSHWDSVDFHQDFEIVELESSSTEYRDVKRSFHSTLAHEHASLLHVFRVQNPSLWDRYCSTKKSMTPRGGLVQEVDERKLFHGTPTLKAARGICANNIDFRRAGENVGAFYGKGSYFSNDAVYSHSYTTGPDCLMFLARVLVGKFTKGQPEFTFPPAREGLKLYDSCVNDEANPTIFVIFDLAQSYPEYLIQYTDVGEMSVVHARPASSHSSAVPAASHVSQSARPLPSTSRVTTVSYPARLPSSSSGSSRATTASYGVLPASAKASGTTTVRPATASYPAQYLPTYSVSGYGGASAYSSDSASSGYVGGSSQRSKSSSSQEKSSRRCIIS